MFFAVPLLTRAALVGLIASLVLISCTGPDLAKQEWDRNLAVLESLLGKSSATGEEIHEAKRFFDRFTRVYVEVEPNMFGWAPGPDMEEDLERIREW